MAHSIALRALLFCLCSAASVAWAQDAREAAAQAAFDRGAQAYAARELSRAAEAFVESWQLAPTANVALNLSQIYGLLGRDEDAYNWWAAHEGLPLAEDERARATAVGAELAARVALLEIELDPPEAELSIDGVVVRHRTLRLAVAPGVHRLLVRSAGHTDAEQETSASRGQVTRIVLRRERLALAPTATSLAASRDVERTRTGAPPSSPARAGARTETSAASEGLGPLRWVGYGAAAALFGVGAVVGVGALDTRSRVMADWSADGENELSQQNLTADLLMGAGLLTAASTLVLDLLLDDSEEETVRASR